VLSGGGITGFLYEMGVLAALEEALEPALPGACCGSFVGHSAAEPQPNSPLLAAFLASSMQRHGAPEHHILSMKKRPRCRWNRVVAAVVIGGLLLGIREVGALSSPAGFDHQIWDRLLREYVDDEGRVDYQCLAAEGRSDLARYLDQVAAVDPEKMSDKDKLAFWINAYNAGIVAAILQQYSPETALSRLQLFRWYAFPVAGKRRTADEIEHEILRQRFTEPRIHFALVCAARSCPKLRREAYIGDRLDEQLDDQARRFINDPARNVIDPARGRVQLSSIFDWFGSDFAAADGSVVEFIARYVVNPEHRKLLQRRDVRIEYLPYDWALNAQEGQRHPAGSVRATCTLRHPGVQRRRAAIVCARGPAFWPGVDFGRVGREHSELRAGL